MDKFLSSEQLQRVGDRYPNSIGPNLSPETALIPDLFGKKKIVGNCIGTHKALQIST